MKLVDLAEKYPDHYGPMLSTWSSMGNIGMRQAGQGRVGGDDDQGDADMKGNEGGEAVEGEIMLILFYRL